MSKLKDQIPEIKAKLENFVPVMDGLSRARNPFELRYFVIGKHDDRVQQYKQAVIEMDAKYKAVIAGLHDQKLRSLEREELEMKLKDGPANRMEEIENERTQLAIDKLDREEKDAKIGMTGAFKEVLDFIAIIEREYSDLIEKTEEELLKTEVEHWKKRFAKQCHLDMMAFGKLSEGNRNSLEMMPKEMQEEILTQSIMRSREVQMFEDGVANKTLVKLAQSYPHQTAFIAPPDGMFVPLKLRKDAPPGYPADRIVDVDRAEIMIATLHRPGDDVWMSQAFYIPSGKNYVKHWLYCPSGEMIGEYRNRVIKDALSLGCTHIFWVDDDLIVDTDALQKLFALDLDVVGGWYVKKDPVPESATLISTPDGQSMMPVPKDSTGVIEIDWVLTAGLTLVKMDVFKKMPYPWYMTTQQGTEDTYFCARLREAGIKCFLDTSIKAIHVDKTTMTGYGFDGIFPVSAKQK